MGSFWARTSLRRISARRVKRTQSALGPRLSSPQPGIKANLEFHFNLRSVLLDFHSFIEKPVFECAFAHTMMLFLSYLVKNSMDPVSVTCKLAMKWHLMRMSANWLCPLNAKLRHVSSRESVGERSRRSKAILNSTFWTHREKLKASRTSESEHASSFKHLQAWANEHSSNLRLIRTKAKVWEQFFKIE